MKFEFKNLGSIEQGEITPGNLTIIAGNNNTGKTYISYAMWGLLNNVTSSPNIKILSNHIDHFIKNGSVEIPISNYTKEYFEYLEVNLKKFSNSLASLFNTKDDFFLNSSVTCTDINIEFDSEFEGSSNVSTGPNAYLQFGWNSSNEVLKIFIEQIKEVELNEFISRFIISIAISSVMFRKIFKIPFIITSERTGIALFYKELDLTKSNILELLKKEKEINHINLLETLTASYAEPIKNNIDNTRFFYETQKKKSIIAKDYPEDFKKINKMLSTILDGSFKYTNDQIFFKTKSVKGKSETLPLYITSSATKSLFLLDLFIRSVADKNQILMIDEPELNLHPSNQILMARILANIVNLGIDVLITTHSDYMIKEFNNLIMLSNEFSGKSKIMKSNGYEDLDTLLPEKVRAYFVEKNTIKEAKTDKFGMDYKLFDDTIIKINRIADDIYYSLGDADE